MVPGHQTSRPSLTAGALIAAGFTFALAMAAINVRATYGARVTADEPQYLLTAISLGEDFDLDIADELADQRFLDFHELPLDPQTIALDDTGRRLSPHDPLLPAMLALPMRLGGWPLARATMALLAAATAGATVWLAVRRFGVGVRTATVVSAALFSAPPLVSYGNQIYPEMAAALAVVVGIAAVTAPGVGPPTSRTAEMGQTAVTVSLTAVAVVAIIALPWLSVKYVPLAAVLAAGLAIRHAGRQRLPSSGPTSGPTPQRPLGARRPTVPTTPAVWLVAAVLAGAAVVYVVFHQRVYDGWTVYAAGDHFVDGELQVVGPNPDYPGRSRRLIGLLVDREFGLAAWTPAYLLLVPAAAAMVRRRPTGWQVLVATLAAGWAVATWVALTMHGWWWPGRQVVAVLPAAVVLLAALVDGRPRLRGALVAATLLGTLSWLWLVVEASTGRRTMVVDFFETANPWYRLWSKVLPDHRAFEASDVALSVVWLVVLGGGAALAWRSACEPGAETGSGTGAPAGSEPGVGHETATSER